VRYSSMPDPFLVLSAGIVKSGLKIWLGDRSFAADASASVVDVLKDKIAGDLDRRQARRFFEDLEIPVANRLRVVRESEFRGMPENEWTAAVLAAGDSFDNARLTAQDLFTRDLDPLYLERQIRVDRQRATRDLSEAGTALYDRLISEGCAYVIEISDKLPHFQVGAFAELLRRDRQIFDLISNVLDRIPEKAKGEPQEARFATAYVRHVATKLDKLELFGLDFESSWYPLSMAYVSLRTDELGEAGREDIELHEAAAKSIEERLATSQRTVILGRAGSGKTTVLQWIAVRAARSDFEGALTRFNGYTPFFVRLREYVGKPLPPPEEFIMGVAPMLAPEMPQGWVRSQLRSGRALVLVDGVDELPASERDQVVVWLQDLAELFPHVRYVITARPAAVSANWLEELSFTRTALEAMPPSLVVAFIQHWHDAACHRLTDSDERTQLARYERSLLTAVGNDRYLRDLADTPLLAGLLCALNRHVRSQLPRRRGEIYARALSMFDQRDRARGIETGDITLDLAAKTHLLADLAFWMVRNGESEIAEDTAIGQLSRSLSSLPGIPNQPAPVFRTLLERSGLLREPAAKRVDFVHRTFQEYLAATAAVDGDAIGELVRNADDDQWREVVIMSAGQANQPQTAQLMQGLLKRTRPAAKSARRRLLAVSCLQEVRSLDPELLQAVEKVIPSLLPPRSQDQAEQLSSAGEALIPLLAQYWTRDVERIAYTIRAASLVGGPQALDLITYAVSQHPSRERSPGLKDELVRAWQYFDTEEYARRVLPLIKSETLIISELPKVAAFLRYATSVTHFLINPFKGIVNLQSLAELPRLEALSFAEARGEQLVGLPVCRNIKRLFLFSYRSNDLSDLQFPPELAVFLIDGSRTISSLAGIEQASSVVDFAIRSCPKIENFDILSRLPNLKAVSIRGSDKLNITALSSRSDLDVEFIPEKSPELYDEMESDETV
jgi:hypothetical protein